MADAQVVLEPDAHVAAEHQSGRGEVELARIADARGRPGEALRAEQVDRRAAHVHELVDRRRVRPEHAEHELDVEGEVDELLLGQVLEVVEVADVVDLVLGLRARLAEQLRQPLDVAEGVAEDVVARRLEVVELPLGHLGALPRLEDPEVERAAVEGRHLGPALGHDARPLLDRHAHTAAARGLDDRVAALADAGQHLLEQAEVGHGLAGLGLAHVDVDDRGARLVRPDGRVDDLRGRDGDGRALAGHAHAAGDGARQEDGVEAHPVTASRSRGGRSRSGESGSTEATNASATATSTQRLAEYDPVRSRIAPSPSGPIAVIV